MRDTEELTATTVRRLSRLEPELELGRLEPEPSGINPTGARLSFNTAHCPLQGRNHFFISAEVMSIQVYGRTAGIPAREDVI